ncbi:CRISPR-associated protein Cas1 [Pirellula staleyi DSM 6068]|uniref:CRISPR-associated endonuclease Cas1 n=1 Tax=Pirellula staleyi (strain ATCC 27377 / DSM 6068 / ICPB 4128) TaxID=530564 RepID=D2R8Z2_PIRSD|nr:CRISPR-associated endonuclease Cas1 [Pirellula staleyi]ADB15819.1 CRISPR-associated protein Cas1 [Pirellula staleyi DSM 6068]
MQIFRVRVLLRIKTATRMHAHHAAILYALLCEAHAAAHQIDPCIPDGLLLDAPEQARLMLAAGSKYAFGFTLLAPTERQACTVVDHLVRGLRKVGRAKTKPKPALGGNFEVELVEDLVAKQTHRTGHPLQPIAIEAITQEIAALEGLVQLTLQFHSPLRAHRPKKARRDGHQFFDDHYFHPQALLHRLQSRIESLGICPAPFQPHLRPQAAAPLDGWPEPASPLPEDAAEPISHSPIPAVVSNELVWLDVSYGPRHSRKTLGGAVGSVKLDGLQPATIATLVWGQYVRIGEGTRFGFGAYRIAELASDPYVCERSTRLLDLATEHPALDQAASKWDLGGGEVQSAARDLVKGTYQPQPCFRLDIPKSNGDRRQLAIPSRLDRVLQRSILDVIAPALELFFEESSFAYRRGLGRHTAARHLSQAFTDGYRWALHADFFDFFDTIDHKLLRRRLAAYLADPSLVEVIMRWVETGAPHPDHGIPTGAPLSPILANLFLDQFDEAMHSVGRRLVRYADDFVVLFRDQSEAQAVISEVRQAAESLRLELNRDKTHTLHLATSFDFLGLHFEPREIWEVTTIDEPQLIEQLGWKERSRKPSGGVLHPLPGESQLATPLPGTLIAGPGIEEILVHGDVLQFKHQDQRGIESIPLHTLREVVVLGAVSLSHRVLSAIQQNAISLLLLDESANRTAYIDCQNAEPDSAGIEAQVDLIRNPESSLAIARQLISAKLHNYATLADAYPPKSHSGNAHRSLMRLAKDAQQASSLPELLGIEGSGAALWYGEIGMRLSPGFHWERRVAPNAHDPVNILLNLAQTVLYRMTQHAIAQAKLVDTLGFLHQPRAGHAALASDMQEPFRHLMDRAVLETVRRIRPEEFEPDERGPFPVRMKPRALRESLAWIHRILALPCNGAGQSSPTAYRLQIFKQVRSFRRFLMDPGGRFEPFRHP